MIIKYDVSNEMQDLINKTIESDAAKKGFGVIYKKYSHQCDWSKDS